MTAVARGTADRLADVRSTVAPYGRFLALLAVVLVAGLLAERTVDDFAGAVERYRLFFQLILAGVVLSLLRSEVGMKTYGLFAPMIVAFILVAAGPLWGLLLFLNVLVVTLVAFLAVKPLQLGTAPRVATLLSVACLSTTMTLLAADVGLLPGFFGSVDVFFPTIISAWYADRVATAVEERGWVAPAIQLLWTIVAVFVAYLVVTNEAIVGWFVRTPEAWVGALAVTVVVGNRPCIRLTEYVRFTDHIDSNAALALLTGGQVWLHNQRLRLRRLVSNGAGELRAVSDVLPMKVRNRYIDRYNPPYLRPAADEKAHINRRFAGLDIDAPETYAVVRDAADLSTAAAVMDEREEFVVKPSAGYGGEGIVVVTGRDGDRFATSKGPRTRAELLGHVRRIVEGHYSGLDPEGTAIVEERLRPARFFRERCGGGVPDVRVIVFRGYPVMAMTRLPTEESEGAANLHMGAVGVGLRVADGTPLGAYQQSRDRHLDRHPDTGADLTDFAVPNWTGILETAVRAAAASGLGYAGVDVVLTEGNVPKVLEVNVRPGLGIQNTTGQGLLARLAAVERLPTTCEFASPDERVALAREWDAHASGYEAAVGAELDRIERGERSEDDRDAHGVDRASGNGTRSSTLSPRRVALAVGGAASLALLAGAQAAGFPVVGVGFVACAVGFVGFLLHHAARYHVGGGGE
ncbi:sugar-transfer associated ATP-grasp domain-containing protein [Halomarina pelagica]|uniref:sugar-transfer associated ATP-grasp domain-containing protein n=1 Tax=Halomarina pelagica TaxID=2961599 RepID=UPI0020C1F2FB|nr:sugar-transfer associated ATP-grasp domain-containing protein [Halomarina sp. BND7]